MKKNTTLTEYIPQPRNPEGETLTSVLLDMFAKIRELSRQYLKLKSHDDESTKEPKA